jgi:hypothetical protein
MDEHSEAEYERTRELLSGLIQQQHDLGELGSNLVMLLLCAGIQPAFRNTLDCKFHPAPPCFQ